MTVQLSRTDLKRAAITEAATTLFLRDGYRGASMEEIATLAGVSKQTVYKQFEHKEQLFSHVVRALVNEASDPVHEAARAVDVAGDVEKDLRTLARRQLELVLRPRLMRLRRLVIAEATRFAQLGELFFELGPQRTIDAIADALEDLAERGALEIADPKLAATHFNWLVMGEPLSRAMLLGLDEPPTARELDRWASAAVDTFLAAFSRDSPGA